MSKTVSKALNLLFLFTDEEPVLSLTQLTRRANLPKPTTFRLLKSLEEAGLVERVTSEQRNPTDQMMYKLGIRCLELGVRVSRHLEIRNRAFLHMKTLRDNVQQSVQLIIRDHDEAMYVEKVDVEHPVRLYTRVGRRAPLYAGACPRILFSFLSREERDRLLERDLVQITEQTITNREQLLNMAEQTIQEGFSFSDSELEEGTASVGTPIFDAYGNVVAALSVAGSSEQILQSFGSPLVESMWKTSAAISRDMGFSKPYPYKTYKNKGGTLR